TPNPRGFCSRHAGAILQVCRRSGQHQRDILRGNVPYTFIGQIGEKRCERCEHWLSLREGRHPATNRPRPLVKASWCIYRTRDASNSITTASTLLPPRIACALSRSARSRGISRLSVSLTCPGTLESLARRAMASRADRSGVEIARFGLGAGEVG